MANLDGYLYNDFFSLSGLPLPGVRLPVVSSAGTGKDECLNVDFSDISDSLMCVADVVSNLVVSPDIQLIRDGNEVISTAGSILTHSLSRSDEGLFTCSVCINVLEAGIQDHCSERNISISREGKHTEGITEYNIIHI